MEELYVNALTSLAEIRGVQLPIVATRNKILDALIAYLPSAENRGLYGINKQEPLWLQVLQLKVIPLITLQRRARSEGVVLNEPLEIYSYYLGEEVLIDEDVIKVLDYSTYTLKMLQVMTATKETNRTKLILNAMDPSRIPDAVTEVALQLRKSGIKPVTIQKIDGVMVPLENAKAYTPEELAGAIYANYNLTSLSTPPPGLPLSAVQKFGKALALLGLNSNTTLSSIPIQQRYQLLYQTIERHAGYPFSTWWLQIKDYVVSLTPQQRNKLAMALGLADIDTPDADVLFALAHGGLPGTVTGDISLIPDTDLPVAMARYGIKLPVRDAREVYLANVDSYTTINPPEESLVSALAVNTAELELYDDFALYAVLPKFVRDPRGRSELLQQLSVQLPRNHFFLCATTVGVAYGTYPDHTCFTWEQINNNLVADTHEWTSEELVQLSRMLHTSAERSAPLVEDIAIRKIIENLDLTPLMASAQYFDITATSYNDRWKDLFIKLWQVALLAYGWSGEGPYPLSQGPVNIKRLLQAQADVGNSLQAMGTDPTVNILNAISAYVLNDDGSIGAVDGSLYQLVTVALDPNGVYDYARVIAQTSYLYLVALYSYRLNSFNPFLI